MALFCDLLEDYDPETEQEFTGESAWYADQFTPVEDEGVDYKEVAAYARDIRSEMKDAFDTIDKKAEWIFGLGLLSIGALAWAAKEWRISWGYFIPSLLCALVSMVFALRSRIPRRTFLPLSIKAALERAESDPEKFHAWIAASTHVAMTGIVLVCNRKVLLLKWATVFLMLGVIAFSIVGLAPISAAPATVSSSSSPPKTTP